MKSSFSSELTYADRPDYAKIYKLLLEGAGLDFHAFQKLEKISQTPLRRLGVEPERGTQEEGESKEGMPTLI